MKAIKRDENDRLRDGTLPQDIEDDVTPMRASRIRLAERFEDEALPMPSDLHAEAAVLAMLLWHGAYSPGTVTLAVVRDVLDRSELFYSAAHRAIFTAVAALHTRGTPPDPVAVHSELNVLGIAGASGGMEYLEQLVGSVQGASETKLRGYAQSIRDTWTRRSVIEAARKMDAAARSGSEQALVIAERAQAYVQKIVSGAVVDASVVRLSTSLGRVVRGVMAGAPPSIPSGFLDVDNASGGLFNKETTILAARSGVGKTTFAGQLAMNVTSNPKQAVLFVSLEMPVDQFNQRFLASCASVDSDSLRRQTVTDAEMRRVLDAAKEIHTRHLYFSDSRHQTMASIHAMAWNLAARLALEGVRLAMIIIDHLGLVTPSASVQRATREEKVAESSRLLSGLAIEFNCPVVALVQIKREYGGGVPDVQHLRESGAIEQDADNVWILHREFDEQGLPKPGKPAILAIRKARYGRKAFLRLSCEPEFARFGDWQVMH